MPDLEGKKTIMQTNEEPTVIVIGSINRDYSAEPGRRVGHHTNLHAAHNGGRGVNHAFQLSRLGAKVWIFGSVGNDQNGIDLKAALEGLDSCELHLTLSGDKMTGITFVSPKPQLEYFHIPGANSQDISQILKAYKDRWPQAACCIADLEIPMANIVVAFSLASDSEAPTINILDASYAATTTLNTRSESKEEMQKVRRDMLKNTDILIVRRKDAVNLIEDDEAYAALAAEIANDDSDRYNAFHDFARYLLQLGPKCIVLTLEEDGCLWGVANNDSYPGRVAIGRVPQVNRLSLYPNSAHAAFAGTLAFHVAQRRSIQNVPKKSEFIRTQDWGYFCRQATAAYVMAGTIDGASESMPSKTQIETVYGVLQTGTRTIMSIDVVGATSTLAEMTMQGCRDYLQTVRDLFEVELRSYRPMDIQWTGDGYWVVFDGARNAVRAALGVLKTQEGHNNQPEHKRPIHCRIGINTGDVVVGADNSAQGLPANLAKRTEVNSKPDKVTITEWTKHLLNPLEFKFSDMVEINPDDSHCNEPSFSVCTVTLRHVDDSSVNTS